MIYSYGGVEELKIYFKIWNIEKFFFNERSTFFWLTEI